MEPTRRERAPTIQANRLHSATLAVYLTKGLDFRTRLRDSKPGRNTTTTTMANKTDAQTLARMYLTASKGEDQPGKRYRKVTCRAILDCAINLGIHKEFKAALLAVRA